MMTFTAPIHTNEQSIDRVLGLGIPVLLVFWRKACAPCQQLDPTLNQLARAYSGKALIAKIDVQDNPTLAQRYGVTQLPELIMLKGRSEAGRAQGAANETALSSWIDGLMAGKAASTPRGPSVALDGANAAAHGSSRPDSNEPTPHREPSPGGGPITLTDATFDRVIGTADTPVLVDFWAPWCGPCRAVAPAVERLAQEFAGRATVAKLNVDENPRTAQRFGVTSIPALYIFKRGQVAERLVGAQPVSVLRQALAGHA